MEPIIYPVEGVYNSSEKIDVSVIVPLFNSRKVIQDQIRKWVEDRDLKVEIVYVDDRCPQQSWRAVMDAWNERRDKRHFTPKIVLSDKNRGFGGANNLGAYHARGESLIFLNSDTVVLPNWIAPMLDLLKDPTVGIVGNLQLKEGGQWHDTIDSAGSEWYWTELNFMHIGRHIYNGKILDKPMSPDNCPKDLLEVGEREMVTGCCFAVRKQVFEELGGFHQKYRIGYWEDSELCLSARARGYKVMYQPESRIYHKLHHSNSGGHKFHDFNKQFFFDKWVESEEIDRYVKAKRLVRSTKVSNVLVKRRAARGDVLMATSMLPAIKEKYPEAHIYFCTDCPEVLKDNPHVHSLISQTERHTVKFQRIYDLDLAYERVPFSNIRDAYGWECNLTPDHPFIACEPVDGLPEKYVVFHAGRTAWVGRDWEEGKHFPSLAEGVRAVGYESVWIGHTGDGFDGRGVDMRGKTTLQQLATIIKKAAIFVGIDSFPFHVAQACRTPGVCFFGSIDPKTRIINDNMKGVTAKNVPCLGCHHRKIAPATVTNVCETGTLACEKLSVEDMWKPVINLLEESCCQNA